MQITLSLKKEDFLLNSIKAFKKKDLNDARQAGEAFCKVVLLDFLQNQKYDKITV